MKPVFITLEGIDGSGKSSACKAVGEHFTKNNIPHQIVEAYPRDENSMFLRDLWINKKVPPVAVLSIILELRKRVLFNQIIPALLEGKVVISDRWHDSTYVYQRAEGIDADIIKWVARTEFFQSVYATMHELGYDQYIFDLIANYSMIYLSIDPEESVRRIAARKLETGQPLDEIEKQGVWHQQKLHDLYRARVTDYEITTGNKVVRINAARDIEAVHKNVLYAVQDFISH